MSNFHLVHSIMQIMICTMYLHVCMYVCKHISICMHECTYVHICVCVCSVVILDDVTMCVHREHAMLVKIAGVRHLVVLINKMDDPTVKWSEERCVSSCCVCVCVCVCVHARTCVYVCVHVSYVCLSGRTPH